MCGTSKALLILGEAQIPGRKSSAHARACLDGAPARSVLRVQRHNCRRRSGATLFRMPADSSSIANCQARLCFAAHAKRRGFLFRPGSSTHRRVRHQICDLQRHASKRYASKHAGCKDDGVHRGPRRGSLKGQLGTDSHGLAMWPDKWHLVQQSTGALEVDVDPSSDSDSDSDNEHALNFRTRTLPGSVRNIFQELREEQAQRAKSSLKSCDLHAENGVVSICSAFCEKCYQ